MIRFLNPAEDVDRAMSGAYNVPLVAVSYAVAAVAAYAGLLTSDRMAAADDRRTQTLWLATGALTLGIGVWAMHFIGMLALELPVPVAYDLPETAMTAVPAVLAVALGMYLVAGKRRRHWRYLTAGAVLGAGVGAMHYSGMAAMRMDAAMAYDPVLFTLSIAVAVVLGILAIYVHGLRRLLIDDAVGAVARLAAAVLIGLAITGMHYVAMGATYFFPAPGRPVTHVVLDPFWLSTAVAVVTALIAASAIAATVVDKRLQEVTRSARVSRQRMMEAIESISDGFILFDASGSLVMCNDVFRDMYPAMQELLRPGVLYRDIVHAWASRRSHFPDQMDAEEYVAKCLRKFETGRTVGDLAEEERLHDGRWMYVRQHSVGSGGMVGVWTDVTPIKQLQAHFENRAMHDDLTGLPNRQLFDDRFEQAANRAQRSGGMVALLYVDLDKFKPINDTLGHGAGDAVLREVAARLRRSVRASDTVARLGGDEFAVVLEPVAGRDVAEQAAVRITASLTQPISIGADTCALGASIGIGLSSGDAIDREAIMKGADAAMYEAKRAGGGTYRVSGG